MTYSKQSLFSQNDPLLRHKGDGAMKVALYCRLSEEDRNKANKTDDSISIQNQKSMFIKEQGQELFVVGFFEIPPPNRRA